MFRNLKAPFFNNYAFIISSFIHSFLPIISITPTTNKTIITYNTQVFIAIYASIWVLKFSAIKIKINSANAAVWTIFNMLWTFSLIVVLITATFVVPRGYAPITAVVRPIKK